MIIIIEGPDGAGKTTLAKALQKEFNLEYHHEGPPPNDVPALWHYGRVLQGLRGKNVVIDRFALGERVYGPALRGRDTLGRAGWTVFQRLAVAVGAIQVVCLPPPNVCFDNWKDSPKAELFKDPSIFWQTYAWFAYLAQLDRYRMITYDHVHTDFYELVYDWDNPGMTPVWITRGVVGNPRAEHLLVGDQVGDVAGPDLPFFSTWGSSEYLTAALGRAGFLEHELAWLNAYDAAMQINAIPTHNVEGEQLDVIALGQRAHDVCVAQRVPHRMVPHPQYWKRFHHHDIDEYARLLKGGQA